MGAILPSTRAQLQPAPAVDWRMIGAEEHRASGGTYYDVTNIGGIWDSIPDHEQNAEGDSLDSDTQQWLSELAEDRWTVGSAQASAWLQAATGVPPLDEVIVLPGEMELRSTAHQRVRNGNFQTPMLLEAYPNPSDGPVFVVCNVPEGVAHASIQFFDLNGRMVKELGLDQGAGIAEIHPGFVSAGIYIAELRLDGIRSGQVKLALQ
ncbi:MAG: T9SS type A sorting domain-containing protein [Flavobacteriales bacterium]